MAKIVGIDFGAKLSGKTVIAHRIDGSEIAFSQCEKKVNADTWLKNQLQELGASDVYIDAPLSLPGAFFGKGSNFHFREADKITNAMSPMFLGGLTARAMDLKHTLVHLTFYEIYPAYFQSQIIQSSSYKKDIGSFLSDLTVKYPLALEKNPSNWHQVDALLALLIGERHQHNRHLVIGNLTEGVIII